MFQQKNWKKSAVITLGIFLSLYLLLVAQLGIALANHEVVSTNLPEIGSFRPYANSLSFIYPTYTYRTTNSAVVHVNKSLAAGYLEALELDDLYTAYPLINFSKNVETDFNLSVDEPVVDPNSYVHPLASVIGNVILEGQIMVSPCASVRGDEGQPIRVCEGANIQDGVVLHGLETEEENHEGHLEYLGGRQFNENGLKVSDGSGYSVYIGREVSLAHQVQIHGPAFVGNNTFIGMQSLVFNASVDANSVVEPGCVIVGVKVGPRKYVPAGSVITSQRDADALPLIYPHYAYEHTNHDVVHVNKALARGYLAIDPSGTLPNIAPNVVTDFSPAPAENPTIASTTYVHPLASVIGNVYLGEEIMVSPGASVRGDEGQPIKVCDKANIQENVVLHGLETEMEGEAVANRQYNSHGELVSDGSGYSVYIGEEVSLAHQVQVHGPAYVGDHTFIGMQSLVFKSKIGHKCVIEPGSVVIGVELDDEVYVPAGTVITSEEDIAKYVRKINWQTYTYKGTNHAVVHVNTALAAGYLALVALDPDGTLDHIAYNVSTDFSPGGDFPSIDSTSFVHPLASVIGNAKLGASIYVSPGASVRGDEGQPIFVGTGANIQDGVVLHGLETEELIMDSETCEEDEWEFIEGRQFNAKGQRVGDGSGYSVYIGQEVSLAHQVQVHGPAYVGDHTFIGMQSLIFNAKVGKNCVVEPGCVIIGVEIGDNVYVPAGSVITQQKAPRSSSYLSPFQNYIPSVTPNFTSMPIFSSYISNYYYSPLSTPISYSWSLPPTFYYQPASLSITPIWNTNNLAINNFLPSLQNRLFQPYWLKQFQPYSYNWFLR